MNTTTIHVVPAPAVTGSARRHAAGYWVVALAFLTVMAFATVPTPLYAIYQQEAGFAPAVVTVVFAAFAVGVMASLVLAGHLSDTLGRRPLILLSIGLEVVSALVFLTSTSLPVLLVARLVCGIGIGTLTATATAHLGELRSVAAPGAGPRHAATVAGLANIGGLALGPLVGGLLAELAPAPLHTPYLVFLVLLLVAAAAVATVPETVARAGTQVPYHPQRVAVPPAGRPAFRAAGASAFTAFAVFGMFTALAPTFLVTVLRRTDHLLAGTVTFAVFAAAAAAQVLAGGWTPRRQVVAGAAALVAGLAVVVVGAVAAQLATFLVGAVVAGVGVGLVFRSAVVRAGALAPAGQRGEVLAALFLTAYAGLTVPVLLTGVALLFLGPVTVLAGFVVLTSAAVLASTAHSLRFV
ncbi:MFS transporter [Nocardioides dongxiaopingii]|uniref:MFS transporter n=1 Tax=Nocardioides dongxiaopingii TaxID=2576036 RepID=UPI001BB0704F|nr:MFS transporter [Nocardioides dongxiaopingii]